MTARHTTSPAKRLATASQRFAAVLRTAAVDETTKTGERVHLSGDKRPLWTTGLDSDWRRYLGQFVLKASTTQQVIRSVAI